MMISAFTAYPIIELNPKDKSKIESILAYGDRLIVGLNTGNLRIYRVNEYRDKIDKSTDQKKRERSSATPKLIDLLKEIEKFSSKAIEQLAIIKESNILISLSNSYVSIHDLNSFTLQEQLVKTKGATTFATTSNIIKDLDTGIPEIISRLAVCVKRKLLVWSWHESELEQHVIEVILTESIRTLQWLSATEVICGLNSGFYLVDILNKSIEDVVGSEAIANTANISGGRFSGVGAASMGYMGLKGYTFKPLVTTLANGKILLTKDVNSLFVSSDGKIVGKKQISWQQAPDAVGYSYPYILALHSPSQSVLEVRNPETLTCLQSISLRNARQLHFPPPTVSLAHAGKGFHVASERCIWRMGSTDYHTQIDELVDRAEFDEAISILNMLEDALLKNKAERLLEIKIKKAQQLFDKRMYQDAIDIFMAQDVQAIPEQVIKLYPRVIAGNISIFDSHPIEENVENGAPAESRTNNIRGTGGNGENFSANGGADLTKSTLVDKTIRNQLKAVSDTSSVKSLKRHGRGESYDTVSTLERHTETALEGKDLENAVLALIGFLVQARNRMKAFLDPETGKIKRIVRKAENGHLQYNFESYLVELASDTDNDQEKKLHDTATLIDTTLFRAYVLVRPQLAGALFRIPNFCDPDVVNQSLLESGRYNDLVDFFYGKRLHRPALELLKHFGMSYTDNSVPEALHGPRRTVNYLQSLPQEMIDLILEFSEWPLQVDPDLGLEIFIADTENAETLPRDKVVSFLQGIDQKLAVRYLEHIINEMGDSNPEFHNKLIESYLVNLKCIEREMRNTEEWKDMMEKLIDFMKKSRQYSLGKTFNLIPKNDPDFYEADAVVLSNMGQHKKALEIYVFKMRDYGKAEEYCYDVYKSSLRKNTAKVISIDQYSTPISLSNDEPIETLTIFHTLLSLYLTPPPPYSQNLPFALLLMSNHGNRLPASSTLSLIPDSISLKSLESYFRSQIRVATSQVNESRVVAGLHKSEVISVQACLLLGEGKNVSAENNFSIGRLPSNGCRNRRVVVSEDRVCPRCYKRLGNSVIVIMPNDSILHYGCLKR